MLCPIFICSSRIELSEEQTKSEPTKLNVKPLYRVTIQVVPNLPLTSKQKFCYSIRPMYWNATFVLMSTGGLAQPEWSHCITNIYFAEVSLQGDHSGCSLGVVDLRKGCVSESGAFTEMQPLYWCQQYKLYGHPVVILQRKIYVSYTGWPFKLCQNFLNWGLVSISWCLLEVKKHTAYT